MPPRRLAPLLALAGLLLLALAPPAQAGSVSACTPALAATRACADHGAPSGSLACEEGWSSGGFSESVSVASGSLASAWVSAGAWCFNYSNYGENPYQSAFAASGATVAGHRASAGASAFHETFYPGSSPSYRAGCFAWGALDATYAPRACPAIPAPWLPVALGLMRDWASANFDCASSWNPLAQACVRGDARGAWAAVSACDANGAARASLLGNLVRSKEAGFATCALADILLA